MKTPAPRLPTPVSAPVSPPMSAPAWVTAPTRQPCSADEPAPTDTVDETVPPAAPRTLTPLAHKLLAWRHALRQRLGTPAATASLWPYAATLSPLVVTSVLAPPWLSWVMGVMGLVALDKLVPALDTQLWQVSAKRGFLTYAVPLQVLTASWVLAMAAMGHASHIPATVFPYLAVLAVAIAPALRWNRARQKRRLPVGVSLRTVSALAVLAHGAAAWQSLGAV
jgi:hypothetical protein